MANDEKIYVNLMTDNYSGWVEYKKHLCEEIDYYTIVEYVDRVCDRICMICGNFDWDARDEWIDEIAKKEGLV